MPRWWLWIRISSHATLLLQATCTTLYPFQVPTVHPLYFRQLSSPGNHCAVPETNIFDKASLLPHWQKQKNRKYEQPILGISSIQPSDKDTEHHVYANIFLETPCTPTSRILVRGWRNRELVAWWSPMSHVYCPNTTNSSFSFFQIVPAREPFVPVTYSQQAGIWVQKMPQIHTQVTWTPISMQDFSLLSLWLFGPATRPHPHLSPCDTLW